MAPCELQQEFRVARERQQDDLGRDLIQAYRVVEIYFSTKQTKHTVELPNLWDLMRKHVNPHLSPRRQTVAEQRAALRQVANAYGLSMRKGTTVIPPEQKPKKVRPRRVPTASTKGRST
jgi:hypothetical protein